MTTPNRILFVARGILTGWAALLALGYAVEMPLLWVLQKTVGGALAQPASVVLDYLCFFAAGWAVGRLRGPRLCVPLFMVSLLFFDLQPLYPLDCRWVLRQIVNTMGDRRYLMGLFLAIVSNGMLLAAAWVGGLKGRPESPLSIVGATGVPRSG